MSPVRFHLTAYDWLSFEEQCRFQTLSKLSKSNGDLTG